MTAVELFDTLVSRLHRGPAKRPVDIPERAKIKFPEYDPIVISCDTFRLTCRPAVSR